MKHFSEVLGFSKQRNGLISLFQVLCDIHLNFHAPLSKKYRIHTLFNVLSTRTKEFLDFTYLFYTKNWLGEYVSAVLNEFSSIYWFSLNYSCFPVVSYIRLSCPSISIAHIYKHLPTHCYEQKKLENTVPQLCYRV